MCDSSAPMADTEQGSAMTWTPIAEAPRDGTEIWAWNGEQQRMRWIEGDGYALWAWAEPLLADIDPVPEQPTFFMPLPDTSSWPPIQDAPRDGRQLWISNGEIGVMHWIEGSEYALWAWSDEYMSDVDPCPEQPTRFCALPSDPPPGDNR